MRTFKQYLTVGIFAVLGITANADIFSDVAKLEKLDSTNTSALDLLNTKEYISPIFYVGDINPRFELSIPMRTRKDNLQMRLRYPEAWKMYSRGEIGEFSYFGFKLYDVESGKLPLEKFLRELQQTIK